MVAISFRFRLRSVLLRSPLARVFARIDFCAVLLTAGIKLTNILFCLLFFTLLRRNVYPKKSNSVCVSTSLSGFHLCSKQSSFSSDAVQVYTLQNAVSVQLTIVEPPAPFDSVTDHRLRTDTREPLDDGVSSTHQTHNGEIDYSERDL